MAPRGDEWSNEIDRRLRVVENALIQHTTRCEEQNKSVLLWMKVLTCVVTLQLGYMILAPDEPLPAFIAKHVLKQ